MSKKERRKVRWNKHHIEWSDSVKDRTFVYYHGEWRPKKNFWEKFGDVLFNVLWVVEITGVTAGILL
jgi:hypothetical protein